MTELVKLLLSHPDKPWDWWGLSGNPAITPEFIISHPDGAWDWNGLLEE